MSYVYRVFGYNAFYNLNVEGDPSILVNFVVDTYDSNYVSASGFIDGSSYHLQVTGQFDKSSPLTTLADLKGPVKSVTSYRNGVLHEYHQLYPGKEIGLAKIGTFVPELYLGDDLFEGSTTNSLGDAATGLSGNDTFIGYGSGENGEPKDYFYGGDGIDKSVYRGTYSEYSIQLTEQIWDERVANGSTVSGIYVTDSIKGRDGCDGLNSVERLQFSDLNLALDTAKGEIAGSAYRIYKAAFDRVPDAGGLGFWINAMDDGVSLLSVAQGFINSAEFNTMYGENATDQHFVTLLYNHVLHREPEGAGYQFWLNSLVSGASRAQVLKDFSESAENIDQTAALIVNGIAYQEYSA